MKRGRICSARNALKGEPCRTEAVALKARKRVGEVHRLVYSIRREFGLAPGILPPIVRSMGDELEIKQNKNEPAHE